MQTYKIYNTNFELGSNMC